MEEAAGVIEPVPIESPSRRRIDWRTGKERACHPRSFWEEHERRRAAGGLSISQYCSEHSLALSTLRRWSAQLKGRGTGPRQKRSSQAKASTSPAAFLPVPIAPVQNEPAEIAHDARCRVEVFTRSGARVRLFDETAERVVQVVMAELAGTR